MTRADTGPLRHRRHRKILKQAKGYRGRRHKTVKVAKQAVERAGQYSYRDRRAKKRVFRALWIQRVNAACRMRGLPYGRFMNGLMRAGIGINRKLLAEIAVHAPESFEALAEEARKALPR